MSAHTAVEPIPVRRMGHYRRPAEFHRPLPLLTLGPNLPQAACKGRGNLWDETVEGETNDQRAQRHAIATRICHSCPERTRCLQTRLADPGLGHGIWGGQAFTHTPSHCAQCGQAVPTDEPYNNLRKYCGELCDKEAAENRRRLRREAKRTRHAPRHCHICETSYAPVHKHQITCGVACQRTNDLRRQKERRAAVGTRADRKTEAE